MTGLIKQKKKGDVYSQLIQQEENNDYASLGPLMEGCILRAAICSLMQSEVRRSEGLFAQSVLELTQGSSSGLRIDRSAESSFKF